MGAAAVPMMAAGSVLSAAGQYQAGRARKAADYFEAGQLEQNAGQVQASSQRSAMEQERQGKLIQSRALAMAASSGGGASDPTVVRIMANLAGETQYRKMTDLYEGEERARQMRLQAAADRVSGDQAEMAGYLGAAGTAIGGVSMASKYGSSNG